MIKFNAKRYLEMPLAYDVEEIWDVNEGCGCLKGNFIDCTDLQAPATDLLQSIDCYSDVSKMDSHYRSYYWFLGCSYSGMCPRDEKQEFKNNYPKTFKALNAFEEEYMHYYEGSGEEGRQKLKVRLVETLKTFTDEIEIVDA